MLPQIHRFLSPRSVITTLAAALTAAALPPAAALADTAEATVVHILSSQIEVTSNGSDYVGTNGLANLVADVRIVIDTEAVGRVKSWSVKIGLRGEHSDILWFPHYGAAKSYAWNERPRRVDRTERLIVPSGLWSGYVRARCNEMADDLRTQGLGETAIFGQDRMLPLAVPIFFDVDTTGAGQGGLFIEGAGWESSAKLELVCKKWAGAAIPQASSSITTEPAKVVNQGLSILERSGLNGVCKIRLDGWITTDLKNAKVTFRYRNQEGKLSQVWEVNTGASKTATFSHWYDIPNTEWAETGQVRIVGVSHDFKSDWADYAMDCVEGGPDALTVNEPPALKMTFVEQGKVMVHGQICPERLKLVGLLEGRGGFSGQVGFVARSGKPWFSAPQDYSITPGQKVLVGADYALDWSGIPAWINEPIRSGRTFDFNVTNEDKAVIASLKGRNHLVVCKLPRLNPAVQGGGGGLAVEPRQPAAPATTSKALRLQPALPGAVVPQTVLPRRPLKQSN